MNSFKKKDENYRKIKKREKEGRGLFIYFAFLFWNRAELR